MSDHILAINGGSSSLKAAMFEMAPTLHRVASCQVSRIGSGGATLCAEVAGHSQPDQAVQALTPKEALDAVIQSFGLDSDTTTLTGVGHRVVHGGPEYSKPELVTPTLLDELRKLEPFDPEHLPSEIGLIEDLMRRLPGIPHVACFDTAFHHDLPTVSRRLAIPRKFDSLGVRRYGFHGLSYAYLMSELQRIDPPSADGRVVLAHLGSGASLAAVRDGKSIDTSMAFTPAAGIPMGTRSGDLDPGLIDYLARSASMSMEQLNRIVHLESGLLGISETSSDMRRLLELEAADPRAAEAVAIFCYEASKRIGAYAAALGGLDVLIFSGGIGEHAPPVRWRICENLRFLGIELDASLNNSNAAVISTGSLPVKVRVIPTNEES